jgi:diamine N-acetyltransferase
MKKEKDSLHFREVTKENFWEIIRLKVLPEQKHVAPNSVSIAEAHFWDYAWYRAIYYGDNPVGFIMLADPVAGETGEDAMFNGRYFLWRLMIDHRYQKRGYGKQAVDLLIEYVKTRPNADYLYCSYSLGEHGPEGFYLKYGFEKTGEKTPGPDGEIVIRIKI